jgi:probable HAF family extracellular repeat protein
MAAWHDAFLWRKGMMKDLGTLPGDSCSNAYQVNSWGQVVGTSEGQTLCAIPTGEHAFLWENGGPMVDLNTLVAPDSGLQLTFAVAINDRGEIEGTGLPTGCAPQDIEFCGHAFVLIPCDENHRYSEGCQESIGENKVPQSRPRLQEPTQQMRTPVAPRRTDGFHIPGFANAQAFIIRSALLAGHSQ